ncbi:MAG: acetolactate synthase small subunit, partial [Rhodobacter sp.]|nr:acetolactate synthase small subunit [Rhodobacter sp.]
MRCRRTGISRAPLSIRKASSSHSACDLREPDAPVNETHTLAVPVDKESGMLARVTGLFSGRGRNIESLTVAGVDHQGHRSRITVVTTGTPQVIWQIKAQLARMALRLAGIFRANVVDSTLESFVFEMTGTPEKID